MYISDIIMVVGERCFPKLKQCFYRCSLRTGMFFICWIGLLWNLCFLSYVVKDPYLVHVENDPTEVPYILRFLDDQTAYRLPEWRPFSRYSRLYYVMEIIAFTIALIGIWTVYNVDVFHF